MNNFTFDDDKNLELKFEKNAEVFWRLNEETIQRDKFRSHGEAYYHSMLSKNFSYQITAHYNFQPIASIVLISFGDSCVYLHGASSNEHRNLMAPYLLQWKGIQMAKKLGCKYYDFWGIAPPTTDGGKSSCFNDFCWQADHEWTGVTRFKVGFGGEVKEFPDSIDIAIKRSAYWLYKVIRKVKGLK